MRRIRDLGITITAEPEEPGYFCGAKKPKPPKPSKKPAHICQKGSTTAIVPTRCPNGGQTCNPPKKGATRFSSDVVLRLRQQLEAQLDT